MIGRTAIALALAVPTLAAAEAVWRRDPPPAGPLAEGPRTLIQPGSEKPACLEVRLKDEYRTPFQLHAVVQHPGGPVGWCDARTLACYTPGPRPGTGYRAPVSMLRWDKGRLTTATKVRYCATFANRGRAPVSAWLARPAPRP
jgi:hypothetical protein